MKKNVIMLVMGIILFSTHIFANDSFPINDMVSLEILDNEYVIEFRTPYCEERVVEVNNLSNSVRFSKIVFGENAESINLIYDRLDNKIKDLGELFDYMEGAGLPNTPFLTLNLQIPQDAKCNVRIEEIEYRDIKSGNVSSTPIPYYLQYSYEPFQEYFAGEEFRVLQMDRIAYSQEQYNEMCTLSDSYGAMGTKGVTVNICPFLYLPREQSVIVLHKAKFFVTVNSSTSLPNMIESELNKKVIAASGAYLYDTYLGVTNKNSTTIEKGKYLIITTSDSYANALTSYITHKRNIGYDVMLHVQDGGYPHDSIALRNYIKSMYDNINSRPQYVLLVGDYSQIPISYGKLNNEDNPPTDIYYACLENSLIGTETNFYPEVYIGRWPVSSTAELIKIANKVISFEQITNNSRRFELYSGTGAYASIFESNNKNAAKKIQDIHWADVHNFKGSDGIDGDFMCQEFIDYNVLMMIYNGHGNMYELGPPYTSINNSKVKTMITTPYFMVGFACSLNHPDLISFGTTWLRDGHRTLAFYGSTVKTSTGSDTYLSKHIFDYFTSQTENIRYAQIMEYSAGKYYNALKNSTRKNETKKYLFLGDPTLFSLGMTGYNGNPKAYIQEHKENQNTIFIGESEQIKSVSVYNILGQLISQINGNFNLSTSSNLLNILNLERDGVYIISINTTEHEYITKINL